MKNLLLLIIIFAGLFSCKAQQTVASLKQIEDCGKRPESGREPCPGMDKGLAIGNILVQSYMA